MWTRHNILWLIQSIYAYSNRESLVGTIGGWRIRLYIRTSLVPIYFISNLSGVNFADTNLSNSELGVCTLTGADLQRARLFGASGGLISLDHAILSGADLTHAVFSEADLKFARLDFCELCGTHFEWTDLRGTDFTNASMLFCTFGEIDFRGVIGLETIRHRARSSIGVDSIYASKGEIPISFMRGCGVPEDFIDFVRDRASVPIPYHSCFISYSTSDDEFAKRLYTDCKTEEYVVGSLRTIFRAERGFMNRLVMQSRGMIVCC